jgi:hypothetical protein
MAIGKSVSARSTHTDKATATPVLAEAAKPEHGGKTALAAVEGKTRLTN